MRPFCSLTLAALAITPLAAQVSPTPERPFRADRYLPVDYRNLVFVDLATMRETGIWDELEVGMLKLVLNQLEREAGFPLARLDRMTMIAEVSQPEGDSGRSPRPLDVVVFEGNAELAVPDKITGSDRYEDDAIGGQDVLRRKSWSNELFFRPRPEVQVIGSADLLTPALTGERKLGRPCPDILSLLAMRKQSLFYFALDMGEAAMNERMTGALFPDVEWPEGDGLQFLMVHASAVGDPDDPNVQLDVVLRHAQAGDGVEVTKAAVEGALKRFGTEAQFRLIAPLLKKVAITTDRGDVMLKLDLGRGRAAAGRLAMMALPLLAGGAPQQARAAKAKAVAEEVVKRPVAVPKPAPERPAGEGKGKGKGNGNER
ncbi:MAG: hypothetical protein NXI31_15575 [bacterium]|nr:hypothetical protein [bacterium]